MWKAAVGFCVLKSYFKITVAEYIICKLSDTAVKIIISLLSMPVIFIVIKI